MTVWRTTDPTARLTDPEALGAPRETTFADAQDDVNFVVFDLDQLPADCSVETVTVRPEQPPGRPEGVAAEDVAQTPWSEGNPSSIRTVVEGEDRRLRVKQFCYDMAPPSASVAPLWETPEPAPVDCGDAVGWLGTDYKDNRGACVQRRRTQIELSVLSGSFDDEELRSVLAGATPAAPEAARAVERTPFHVLHYWARYGIDPPGVPHGLWEQATARPYETSVLLSELALRREDVPVLVPSGEGYLLDSAVAFPSADAVECVYRRRENDSDHLWLQAAPADSDLAPSMPPEPSAQPAAIREDLELRDTSVYYAALTEADGAWEAVWSEDGVRYAAWAGSSQYLTGSEFRATIESLATP